MQNHFCAVAGTFVYVEVAKKLFEGQVGLYLILLL